MLVNKAFNYNMDDFDLNLNDYNYQDFLNIFNIHNILNKSENVVKINEKCKNVSSNFKGEIVDFFLKCKMILFTLMDLIETNDIRNIKDDKEINKYINKIKEISYFENYHQEELVNKISVFSSTKENTRVYPSLNKPILNVSSNHPSINNENNTNTIINTFPNDVSPGDLNALKRITQTYNLNLNSCFRSNYYQSNPCDFIYSIPVEVKNVISMRLVSIEIPNSWYLFSSQKKNNVFQIEIQANEERKIYDIFIPDGNYDSESLQYYLNHTYFYQTSMETYLRYIQFSIDEFSLKTKFEILEHDFQKFQFSVKFVDGLNQNIMNSCGWLLGFRLANYLDIKNRLVSEGLFDAGGDRYIYLCINDFQYNNNISNSVCFDQSILKEDVIAKIPMVNGKLSLIINDETNPLAKIRKYNGPVTLSKLQIKILDKFGDIIDLNHMDFSLTIELQILYESFNFKNINY